MCQHSYLLLVTALTQGGRLLGGGTGAIWSLTALVLTVFQMAFSLKPWGSELV